MIKIVFAQFGYADIRSPRLRLHDVRVQFTKPRRQFALYLDGLVAGQVKMQIRHGDSLLASHADS